ncbi:recombinase family protein [Streptomyces herbicida]|uniref:recombinase family protein n=1 Tax=Streptomyces herbicida TaxID=3065675 RepID=UPI00292DF0FC|nr:recombinase family protein [Streptomyces sp. NEAU-HV9]
MDDLVAHCGPGLNRVTSYARTSEDFRQRDGHGVRHQLRINERIAHEHGCQVVAVYTDNGCTASKPGVARPGFDRLLGDLKRGDVADGRALDGVVCVATTACIGALRISPDSSPR